MIGRRIAVQGTVQGVGFRPWVYQLAQQLKLSGTVQNGPDGVTIDAFAPAAVLDTLLSRLARELPAAARIDRLVWQPLDAPAPTGFAILDSTHRGAAQASIPADLAMCDACRDEIHDPSARRHRYAFTNCTHCGPRLSIATSVPYDRARTTLAGFPLCADCRREYEDPADRRFHAQPLGCPACGPRLSWAGATGIAVDAADPLQIAADALNAGQIVALRGLGGFHLACDARREDVVAELRRRKHRDEKPLAVMVRDLETAQALADLGPGEREALTSPGRPIVLVARRDPSALAPSVAPGLCQVGLFLPYTPMHALLMERVRGPLVMTSGNRSDEPMAVTNEDAVARLLGVADGFLLHDRPIATRIDDSVVRVVAGAPMVLRRARGYVPQSLASPRPFAEPVLALGGQLKNTFCIGSGTRLTLGPHVGDLADLTTSDDAAAMIARLEQLLDVAPRVLVHDAHPDYDSTRYALQRPARQRLAVQHHHAHVAAVMAEHHLAGPVIGVAFDGSGYGLDGTAWGGEVLLARYGGFERRVTLRPVGLVGGDRAVADVWRIALAALDDAFDGAAPLNALRLFDAVKPTDLANVQRLIGTGFRVAQAHGAGRMFDAAAALVLARPRARFEAQLAMALEQTAQGAADAWPFALDRAQTPWQLDLRPMWRALVADLVAGVPPPALAARFHATLGAAVAEAVRAIAEVEGIRPVVLSGGCFANARLVDEVLCRLGGFDVALPRQVPPGDGGLALGQAVVAAARLQGET